ncbi:hypothetical protein CMI38_02285 [Candidatus Pacearchaeota archaeon]|nr:hypothetical protein [Candidatus Pacearchaeota archaeon]
MDSVEDRLRIEGDVSGLFVRALDTVPVVPELVEGVNFYADGINFNVDNYEAKCLENGIMPKTYLGVKYRLTSEGFRLGPYDNNFDQVDRSFEVFSRGGKIHRFGFETFIYGNECFEDFKSRVLDLIDGGYEVDDGFLALTTYRTTGYNEGTHADAGLRVKKGGIEFDSGFRTGENEVGKFRRWFLSLK